MNYSFHPEAEAEFLQAIDYYEEKAVGLGHEFAVEVYAAIEICATFPKAWPIIEEGVRRSLIKRFPYGVLYSESENQMYILAVMHLHREPFYWQDRTLQMK